MNPLKVALDAARAQGAEFHVMLRPAGWVGSMPYEETFNRKFYYAHPEWRCFDRDGTPTFFMSYALPKCDGNSSRFSARQSSCSPRASASSLIAACR